MFKFFRREKPKVGLGIALGSGGAKGMAHIGALKAFEEKMYGDVWEKEKPFIGAFLL